MSTSYDNHKSQVESARKNNGEFGSYESGESAASLVAPEAEDRGYDREEAKTMLDSEGLYAVETSGNTHAVIETTEAGWDVYTDIGGSKSGDIDSHDDLQTALTAFEDRIAHETPWDDDEEENQSLAAASQGDWFTPPSPPMSPPTSDELASSIDQAMEGRDWQAVDVGDHGNGVEVFGLADDKGNKLVEVRNDKTRGFQEVWDHSADQPRMVSSTTAGYATAEDIASRAADHFDALSSGRDPLEEAQWRDYQHPRDGMPASHGFDFTETHPDTQQLAFNINESFGADHEVLGYDTGGGTEILSVAGGQTGQRYEAKIGSLEGGNLDSPGWAVTAAYQSSNGEWVEDDDELTFSPAEIEENDDYAAVRDAVTTKLNQARYKARYNRFQRH